jgi:hypothetical protein
MFLWWVGSWPTAPTPNLEDQDFLSGFSPLAFGVPTPLLQGNNVCNSRQGPLQGAISRSQPNTMNTCFIINNIKFTKILSLIGDFGQIGEKSEQNAYAGLLNE